MAFDLKRLTAAAVEAALQEEQPQPKRTRGSTMRAVLAGAALATVARVAVTKAPGLLRVPDLDDLKERARDRLAGLGLVDGEPLDDVRYDEDEDYAEDEEEEEAEPEDEEPEEPEDEEPEEPEELRGRAAGRRRGNPASSCSSTSSSRSSRARWATARRGAGRSRPQSSAIRARWRARSSSRRSSKTSHWG